MIALLQSIVGANHVLTETADVAPYLTDWRKRFTGRAAAVVLPADTGQVAQVVRLCARLRLPIVPQGGNTGLVVGATPDVSGRAVVLSLRRMRAIRSVDPINNTLVADAGCVLAQVQEAARAAARLFPLSLAAEGSCTLGGNLSTNAGGTQVLRYGNARELCLGLEVVTPAGDIWDGLRGLRKDNTGYDLRDLFIGAEGTLGIITAACMKLYPLPKAHATALMALGEVSDAQALLELAQNLSGPSLTAFELFSDFCLGLVEKHFPPCKTPFAERHPQYVLLELSDHESEVHANQSFEHLMQVAFDAGLIRDAAIAQSIAQSRAFWTLRENISEAQAHEGRNIKHDISVPISRIGEFVAQTGALLQHEYPGVRMVVFGHLGDGNLHYNISPALDTHGRPESEATFLAKQDSIYKIVHDQVVAFRGSISAEHGIGQLKREENSRYKSPVEMAMMRAIKDALDPQGIMNPAKVI